ncbi:hypothetical protein [Aerosakkonema funiforme]|uniref:hypothetical protein n=1 Tax=Aerosakkonema funiforme TaxID=1246630 RepID=UPI0035B71188
MDPLSILTWAVVWAAVSASIYTVVYFANLTFEIIYNWFRGFAYLLIANDTRPLANREGVGFTAINSNTLTNKIKDAIQNPKDINIVQGVFDNRTGKIIGSRVMNASSLDPTIKEAHNYGRKEIAFYNI